MKAEEDDVALKLVHTADWHLGRSFPSFDEDDQKKLSRARLAVIDAILGVANQVGADAVLCAGDLFDDIDPGEKWWRELLKKLKMQLPSRPIFLLPGNHDPLVARSVYDDEHEFRKSLPPWVHVVDRDDFSYELTPDAVLVAAPCRSKAGQQDLALALPARAAGDDRIRIGLVHGSTFDMKGFQSNFPIARDAAKRQGLDYLAIGDTHNFREVPEGERPLTVYPSAPEPTTFGEPDAGYCAIVFVTRGRHVTLRKERVAHWQWGEETCRTLAELRAIRDGVDRSHHVLRLTVDMRLPAPELDEAERILQELKGTDATHGRVGVLLVERKEMALDTGSVEKLLSDLPDVLKATLHRLKELEAGPEPDVARRAIMHLYRAVQER